MKLFCEKCKKDFAVEKADGIVQTHCPLCGDEIAIPENTVAPGVVLGDFLIESLIARGGMGEVYLARQLSLDRHVALKVLQNKHTDDKDYVESLFREARAAAKINHPNVVQAYAIGEEDGIFYFAMEYIRGETFKTILKNRGGKLELDQAVRVVRDIARAISAAWREQKLVHQDIKPDNIMLDANGFAKLADLGLAKSAAHGDEGTVSDEVLGTPQYISPEQLTGVPTDVRSDIYSLGATFYQFVTGRYAYVADSLDKLPQMHVDGNLEPPKSVNPELPDEINSIIVKMMARFPENRYQNADELVADLEKYMHSSKSAAADEKSKPAVPVLPKIKVGTAGGRKVPAVPATVKLVAPAAGKPAVPSKPAVPPTVPGGAKPAVPPTVPGGAKPAVPPTVPGGAKPAVPPTVPGGAKPAVPVATPAAEAKTVANAKDEKSAPEVKDAPKTEVKAKPEKKPFPVRKCIAWCSIGFAGLVILGIAFIVTVFILGRKDKLPQFLKPLSDYMNAGVAKAKDKAIELAKPQDIVHEVVTGPVTRREYLNKVEELVKFRRSNPDKREEFFNLADEAYEMLVQPVTDEEKAAFRNFLQSFGPADEQFRCAVARNQMRQQFLKMLSERVNAREAAEAERLEQERLKARQAEEAARRNQEIRERNKREKLEQEKQIKAFKAQCAEWSRKLACAMVDSLISGERTVWDGVKHEVTDFIKMSIGKTEEERNGIAQLNKFITACEREMKSVVAYQSELAKISARDNIYVTLNRRGMVVAKVEPGVITVVPRDSGREQKTVIRNFQNEVRNRLCRRLKSKYPKLNNLDFFISLFDKHVDPIALKDKPAKGFWKDYWQYFAKDFQKK